MEDKPGTFEGLSVDTDDTAGAVTDEVCDLNALVADECPAMFEAANVDVGNTELRRESLLLIADESSAILDVTSFHVGK